MFRCEIKSRRRWAGHVERMGEIRNLGPIHKFCLKTQKQQKTSLRAKCEKYFSEIWCELHLTG
jgi:hypothetical protein